MSAGINWIETEKNCCIVEWAKLRRIWSWGQGGKAGCVPFVFRYAKHSDEPLKRKPVGVRPSCFPGLISMAYIHPPGTQPAFPPWENQNSQAGICSLKVFPTGPRFLLCSGKISALSTQGLCIADRFSRVHNHIAFT